MSSASTGITALLHACDGAAGREAFDRLMPAVLTELRQIARRQLCGERRGISLSPTALVSELYLRWCRQTAPRWRDRGQFFAVAAAQIRRILVDHARWKRAAKRGPEGSRGPFPEEAKGPALRPAQDGLADSLDLQRALAKLEGLDPELRRLVDLRFFLGFSAAETAKAMAISERTVMRRWAWARAWLVRELGRPSPPS
ncbi:MAG: ECF-type sigma factor [Acidobacteriota bacterium]